MVCAQVIGNDTTIALSGSQGNFELNVFKPVMIFNYLNSVELLSSACRSFREHMLIGLQPNLEQIATHLNNSLMLVTALNPHIGYDKAAAVAKVAHSEGITLQQAAVKLGILTKEEFASLVRPSDMLSPQG